MIFLNINIAIGIVFLILHTLLAIDSSHDFKRIYPDLKVKKSNWAGSLLTIIKTIIIALIPLLNFMLCCVYVFKTSELKANAIEKVYLECMKEKQNVTHLSETSER